MPARSVLVRALSAGLTVALRVRVKGLVVAALVGTWGCAFQPGSYGDTPAPDAAGGPGGGSGSAAPPEDDAGSPQVARQCTFADPELRLCIELDDRKFSPNVTDASQRQLSPTATLVSEAPHGAGYAAAMAPSSHIDVAENMALDPLSGITIEMWIWPAYPHSANLVVNANQYTLQIAGDGRVGCLLPVALEWSSDERRARPQEWTHVACTYQDDGSIEVYVNGRASDGASASAGGLSDAGKTGTRIGGGYAGGMDDIRIYGRALAKEEVCTHAGKTDCD
jgi:hypothetical protein